MHARFTCWRTAVRARDGLATRAVISVHGGLLLLCLVALLPVDVLCGGVAKTVMVMC